VSDARERLRQYLEQRRELGESEFVLDSLSVEDALKVLTTGATPPAAPAPRAASAGSGASASPRGPAADPPRAARTTGVTEDWRSIVGAPDAKARPEPPTRPDASVAPVPVDLGSATTLADVAKAIAVCKACSLSATALNHVPGEGNPNAKFVVVGEAPGATEDELGRPFVGKSGDLLTKILEAVGFKREDVFICNVLKHRPPGNRNPTPDEVVACAPFLLKQLDVLQPKVILALGNFAAQTLLNTDVGITKLRGIEHTYHGIQLVATFHPAALLRNPNFKRPAWEDVQLARRIFDRP
jgi:uracil-DNA glycosylase family 4